MRICALSDTHGYLPRIQPCDSIFITGDICPGGIASEQAKWIRQEFRPWLKRLDAGYKIIVPGNHDWVFTEHPSILSNLRNQQIEVLIDRETRVDGLKVYGTPWQPFFCHWAFNAPRNDTEEVFLTRKYAKIPKGTNILMTHAPPYGLGDRVIRGENVGSKALLEAIDRVQPQLVLCGHIHEAYGSYKYKNTLVVNASYVDEYLNPLHEPVYLEF